MLLAGAAPLFAQGPPGGKKMPPQVGLAPAAVKTVPVTFEYVGLTEASKTVEVRARIQGFLETREFQDGAYLKEGARLFTIDPRPFEGPGLAARRWPRPRAASAGRSQELARLKACGTRGGGRGRRGPARGRGGGGGGGAAAGEAQLKKAELNLDSHKGSPPPLTGFIGKAQKEAGSYVDSARTALLGRDAPGGARL
jgi:membrane fusion protein (multidrug efflux system)